MTGRHGRRASLQADGSVAISDKISGGPTALSTQRRRSLHPLGTYSPRIGEARGRRSSHWGDLVKFARSKMSSPMEKKKFFNIVVTGPDGIRHVVSY